MPATAPTRIRLAARFRANDLHICILIRNWAEEAKCLIRVASATQYGGDPLGGWLNGRWRELSPLLTYWGPLLPAPDPLDSLLASKSDTNLLKESMQEVAEAYLLSQLDSVTASELKGKLKQQLRSVSLIDFVDGDSADRDQHVLSLASAQNVAAKVVSKAPLEPEDCETLQLLLTQAPLQFGYWGPFKTVLKTIDPALMPQEFGGALARLSEPAARIPPSGVIESLDWMSSFNDIPTDQTKLYMARRMRRRLAEIGTFDPELYVAIASSLLKAWDSHLDACSYLPAYILGGDQPVLSHAGRFVDLPLIQSARRDAHPAAWNQHLQLVRELLSDIRLSAETFTFASQVLLDIAEELPALNATQLLLSLRSSDTRLVARACQHLPEHPDVWDSLDQDLWKVFISGAETSQVRAVLETLEGSISTTIVSSIANQLSLIDDYQKLNTADQERCLLLANFYFKAVTSGQDSLHYCATSSATITALVALGCSIRFADDGDLWAVRLKGVESDEVLDAYQQLTEGLLAQSDNLHALESALLAAELPDYATCDLALQALQIPTARAVELGWALIDRCEDPEDIIDKVWQWLGDITPPESFTPEGWYERRVVLIGELLARSTDITARVNELLCTDAWQLSSASLASLISGSPASLKAIWDALALDEGSSSTGLRTLLDDEPALALTIGDVLVAEDLVTTSELQQELLLRYVRERDRICSDITFAVAAVAVPAPRLQRECLAQLSRSGTLGDCWLRLAELGLPQPLEAMRAFITDIHDSADFTDCVLACVDSIVTTVRDLGLEFLYSHRERIDHERLWPALSESDDPVVQARVAEESLSRSWPDTTGLADFDRRLLVTRRTNRRAKSQVQSRLTREHMLAPVRRAALMDLARGANRKDREWALRRIAELALTGVQFDEVAVQMITAGTDRKA